MDIEFIYIISVIIVLFLALKILQDKRTEKNELLLDISSHTLTGMIIIVMLYTDDIRLLSALIFICLPFSIYSFYRQYKKDKKELIISFSILAAILIIVWTAAL